MAAARNEVSGNAQNQSQLLEKLDQTLAEIREAMASGIMQGKLQPNETTSAQLLIFNDLCDELSASAVLNDYNEIKNYFQKIQKNLQPKLESYSLSHTKNNKKHSENFFLMLKHFINVYAEIAKHKFYLQHLQMNTQISSSRYFEIAEDTNHKKEKKIAKLNLNHIQNKLNRFDFTLQKIIERLEKNGYGKLDFDFKEYKEISEINFMMEPLQSLPTAEAMNIVITDLIKAREENDKEKILASEAELQKHIQELEITKIEFMDLAQNLLKQYQSMFDALNQQQITLVNSNINMQNLFQKLQIIFQDLISINGYSDKEGNVHKGYPEIQEQTNNLIKTCLIQNEGFLSHTSKYWISATERMNVAVDNLSSEFNIFLKPSLKDFNKLTNLNEERVKNESEYQNLHTVSARLEALIDKAKKIFFITGSAINQVQVTLAQHATHHETTNEYIKNFFTQHKLKIGIGCLTGVGVGVLVGLLLSPAAAIVLPFAGLGIGFGLSAILGLTTDIIKDKKVQNAGPAKIPSPNTAKSSFGEFWKQIKAKLVSTTEPEEVPRLASANNLTPIK